jgi:hypothetical protein
MARGGHGDARHRGQYVVDAHPGHRDATVLGDVLHGIHYRRVDGSVECGHPFTTATMPRTLTAGG